MADALWTSLFAVPHRIADCRLQIADYAEPNLKSAIYNLQSEGERTMSQYTMEELIVRWKQEEMTADQMIGQILLVLQAMLQRQRELERQRPPSAEGTPGTPRRPA
jgi:hypothetical protein